MTQNPKRIEHMARRREQGLTHKELGDEYGVSRQHVGRILRKNSKKDDSCEEETI